MAHASVTRDCRNQQNGHKSTVIWFTGLSGSGKSTQKVLQLLKAGVFIDTFYNLQ